MKRPSSENEASPPASFASVTRKVSGWTTNLLATGFILVLALGLGRQLVGWWRIEPQQALPALPTIDSGLGGTDPTAPYTLEFGDSPYSIDERTIQGDRAEAVRQLLVSCRQAAAESSPPVEPAGETEEKLLETVRLLEPLEVSGSVRFYGPDTGIPLVVAIAPAAPSGAEEPAAAQLGASRDRVLVWAIAASAGENAWSLYTFRLGQRQTSAAVEVPSVSLPPGSRRTMALHDARGETLLGFTGSNASGDDQHAADEWRRSFAAQLNRTGWTIAQDWQLAGDVWHARYARGEGPRRWTVDLQFGPDMNGQLSGLVRIVPPPAPMNAVPVEQAPVSHREQR